MLRHMYARNTRIGALARIASRGGNGHCETVPGHLLKLCADWSHLIEYQKKTHVNERMKRLHCMSQDMEALAKMLVAISNRFPFQIPRVPLNNMARV